MIQIRSEPQLPEERIAASVLLPDHNGPRGWLPLVEPIERIIVGAEVLRQPALASNGAVEHPTKCDTIDGAGMDVEANDPELSGYRVHSRRDKATGKD